MQNGKKVGLNERLLKRKVRFQQLRFWNLLFHKRWKWSELEGGRSLSNSLRLSNRGTKNFIEYFMEIDYDFLISLPHSINFRWMISSWENLAICCWYIYCCSITMVKFIFDAFWFWNSAINFCLHSNLLPDAPQCLTLNIINRKLSIISPKPSSATLNKLPFWCLLLIFEFYH